MITSTVYYTLALITLIFNVIAYSAADLWCDDMIGNYTSIHNNMLYSIEVSSIFIAIGLIEIILNLIYMRVNKQYIDPRRLCGRVAIVSIVSTTFTFLILCVVLIRVYTMSNCRFHDNNDALIIIIVNCILEVAQVISAYMHMYAVTIAHENNIGFDQL
jgi:hypothetical protein